MQPFLGQPVYPKQLPGKGNHEVREERRLVWRVLGRWKEVAGGKRFPSHEEIESWVRDEDGKNCLLIAVESPVELSHFVAVGVNLAVALCPNDTLACVLLSKVPRVVSARRGLMIEGSAILRGTCILYLSLLLPLFDRGCDRPYLWRHELPLRTRRRGAADETGYLPDAVDLGR